MFHRPNRFDKIRRERCFELHHFICSGMTEGKLPSVQHLTRKRRSVFATVRFVAQHRVGKMMKMHSDLVSSAAVQGTFEKAHLVSGAKEAIFRLRRTPFPRGNAHTLSVHRMSANGSIDYATCLSRNPSHKREINFLGGAGGKLFR